VAVTTKITLCFVLACAHVMPGNPGDVKCYCHYCQEPKPIAGVHVYEWKADCQTCNYARWHGLSRDLANRTANQHARTTGFHKVGVLYLARPDAVKTMQNMMRNSLFAKPEEK
jgi:hypothetical protein